jgi:hypothetical protein
LLFISLFPSPNDPRVRESHERAKKGRKRDKMDESKYTTIKDDLNEMKILLKRGMVESEEQEQLFKRLDRAIVSITDLVRLIKTGEDHSIIEFLTNQRQELVESSWIIDVAEHYHRPLKDAKLNQLNVMWSIVFEMERLLEFYNWVTLVAAVQDKPFKRTRLTFEAWKKGE